jgi:hypothetical protein
MEFDKKYIAILALLGIILLYSYYYYFQNDKNSKFLWGKVKGNLLSVYYVSMLLSAIGFLLLFSYLFINKNFKQSDINYIFGYLCAIIIISIFWMPLSLQYIKHKSELFKYLTIITLFLVALFTLLLLQLLLNLKDNQNIIIKNLSIIGILYFFIHAFFFDFITWSYNFF